MKKIIGLLCLLMMLTACHGSRGQSAFEVPDDFDMSKEYTISFWAKNDTNASQVKVYKDAIASFEEYYPNIHVELKLYTDYGRIYNDVITNISTKTTPDVCITYPDHIATYITGNNVVVPLDELMSDEKYGFGGSDVKYDSIKKEEIVTNFLDEGVINGVQYALPYMRSTEALYINEDFVRKLGYEVPEVLTWDFVWEVSEAAMAKDDEGNFLLNGQKVLIPFIYKSTDNMMITMLKQADIPYSDDDGNVLLFNDDTQAILEEIAVHGGDLSFSTFKISSYPANFLDAGQCIFAIDSTAGATWMGSNAPLVDIAEDKMVHFNTVLRMIPQYDVDNPQMMSQGPSICVFNKDDSGRVLASWLFAQYLLTNDVQINYAETEGYLPVTYKASESEEYQNYLSLKGSDDDEHYYLKIEASQLLMDNIDNTFVTSVFNGSASLRDAAGDLIESVVKSAKRQEVMDDAYYDSLFEKMNLLYHLDQTSKVDGSSHNLGPLPGASKALLITLGAVWVAIGAYYFYDKKRK